MAQVQLGPATAMRPVDVQAIWVSNGGDPAKAPLAAAVVFGAENPAGNAGLVNDTPATGDYSVGLWQINYYGGLEAGQTARFGSASDLAADPNLQAKAAIAMSANGSNWQPWGPDFGFSGYGSIVSAPLAGSKVARWLSANGYGSLVAGAAPAPLASLPWKQIAAVGAAGALLVAAGGLAWVMLTPESRVPAPLRRFALPNPVGARASDTDLPSMTVQSLLFPRPRWNVHDARRWAQRHGYYDRDVEVTPRYIHLVQMPTKGFSVIRTIQLPGKGGIKAHVARES